MQTLSPSRVASPRTSIFDGATTEIYRTAPEAELEMHILKPAPSQGVPCPAAVFFFGGGWQRGTVSQFLPQARHYAAQGMACFLVDYRVENRHGTSPLAAVEDARAAMRYLKKNAGRLHIDPRRLVAAGGSAGGHLAFCTALATTINAEEDDLSLDPSPSLIVAFNPVCDTSEAGFGEKQFPAGTARLASPLHLVNSRMPRTLILHGTADTVVPVGQARAMQQAMLNAGVPCSLIEYENQGHGFFNADPYQAETLAEVDGFLARANFLP